MVDFDYEKFNSVTHCHVCEKPFAPDECAIIAIDSIQMFRPFELLKL